LTQFGDSVRFPFSTSICEKDIRNLLLLEDFQGVCPSGDGIRAKHEDAIDIECESIIERRMTSMRGTFGRMLEMTDGIAAISSSKKGCTWVNELWRQGMRQLLEEI
jgi:hypothetical protein